MQKLLIGDKEYSEYEYSSEEEFEKDLVDNVKKVFGNKTAYIDVKKILKRKFTNSSIPDGYFIRLYY